MGECSSYILINDDKLYYSMTRINRIKNTVFLNQICTFLKGNYLLLLTPFFMYVSDVLLLIMN